MWPGQSDSNASILSTMSDIFTLLFFLSLLVPGPLLAHNKFLATDPTSAVQTWLSPIFICFGGGGRSLLALLLLLFISNCLSPRSSCFPSSLLALAGRRPYRTLEANLCCCPSSAKSSQASYFPSSKLMDSDAGGPSTLFLCWRGGSTLMPTVETMQNHVNHLVNIYIYIYYKSSQHKDIA